MSVNLVTWNESLVTPLDDALVYHTAIENSGIIYGAEVSIKSSNVLHITSGHAILCGRKVTIEEEDIAVVLPSSGNLNGRLYLHMDLSNTGDPIQLLTEIAATLTPEVQDENVNINLGVFETNICTFNAMPEGLTDLQMVAKEALSSGAVAESIVATVEKGGTFSRAYGIGESFIYKNKIYRTRAAITQGARIEEVLQTSAIEITVSMYLLELNNMISYFNNQIDDIEGNVFQHPAAVNGVSLAAINKGEFFTNRDDYKEYSYFDNDYVYIGHDVFFAKENISPGQQLTESNSVRFPDLLAVFDMMWKELLNRLSIAGGTITGNLTIDRKDGTASVNGDSTLHIGNNTSMGVAGNSRGNLRLYCNGYFARLYPRQLSGSRGYQLPDKDGIIALTSDIPTLPDLSSSIVSINIGTYQASSSQPWRLVRYGKLRILHIAPVKGLTVGSAVVVTTIQASDCPIANIGQDFTDVANGTTKKFRVTFYQNGQVNVYAYNDAAGNIQGTLVYVTA